MFVCVYDGVVGNMYVSICVQKSVQEYVQYVYDGVAIHMYACIKGSVQEYANAQLMVFDA